MKKILLSLIVLSTLLTSCLKDTTINNDLNARNNTVMVQYSGLNYFSTRAVIAAGQTDPITTSFTANYNNADFATLSKDVTLTFVVDDAARIAYNASGSGVYDAMPDSVYSFPTKSAIIKAGTNLATLSVIFYPTKIDPSKSYMLAITLSDAQGQTIASNFSTVYFHIIGNPLAGNYTTTGKRYNYTGAVNWTGPPAAYPSGFSDGTTGAYTGTVTALPVNASTIKLIMGNVPDPQPVGGSAYYYITANASFSTITYNNGSNFDAGYSNAQRYVVSYTPPSSTQKASFHLVTKYNNTTGGAGNDRLIDQTFTHL